MTDKPKRPVPKGGAMRMLTDEIIDGLDLEDIKCRSCSGYGNCGYKSHFLSDQGAVSICMRMRKQLQCERDGVPFDPDAPLV